jgi:hypothetical protein
MNRFIIPLIRLLFAVVLMHLPVKQLMASEVEIWHQFIKRLSSGHLNHDLEYQPRFEDLYKTGSTQVLRVDNRFKGQNPFSFGAGHFSRDNRSELRPHVYHLIDAYREYFEIRNGLEYRNYNDGEAQWRYRLRGFLKILGHGQYQFFLADEVFFHLDSGQSGPAGFSEHRYGGMLETRLKSHQVNLQLWRIEQFGFNSRQYMMLRLALII